MGHSGPSAGVIVVGTELTLGRSIDSNSAYLCNWLSERGIEVRLAIKLPDDIDPIAEYIRYLVKRVEIIMITGGLGATHDDITREALSSALDLPLVFDKSTADTIEKNIPPGADSVRFMNQAKLPKETKAIRPIKGTAPGIVIAVADKKIYALPGVPVEMKAMLGEVEKDLKTSFGEQEKPIVKTIKVIGKSEPAIATMIDPILHRYPKLALNILAKPGEIRLNLMVKGNARKIIDSAADGIAAILGDLVYSTEDETLSSVVGKLLLADSLTVGVAESITAGGISADIAATPGSSRYFNGGIVAYKNSAKERLLNVSRDTLTEKGAVSAETAAEMAQGVRKALDADIGLSVTGIAGPSGATPGKPVGLVYVGLSADEKETVVELRLRGSRQAIQNRTVVDALNRLRLFLTGIKNGR